MTLAPVARASITVKGTTMSKHFELTGETKTTRDGRTVHRIKALIDLPRHGVKAGETGGWVEKEDNVSGNAWVHGDAWVYGNARVSGNAWVYGDARVHGNAWVSGNAGVSGNAWVSGNAEVYGDAWVHGNARVENRWHLLTAVITTTATLHCTLTATADGWHVQAGCWSGTVPELRALAESDQWVDTQGTEATDEARPELLAFVALCEARVARVAAHEVTR